MTVSAVLAPFQYLIENRFADYNYYYNFRRITSKSPFLNGKSELTYVFLGVASYRGVPYKGA